jgi:hypothetical protein
MVNPQLKATHAEGAHSFGIHQSGASVPFIERLWTGNEFGVRRRMWEVLVFAAGATAAAEFPLGYDGRLAGEQR